jgi:hypothetical protein
VGEDRLGEPIFWTPAMIADYLATTDRHIRAFDRDVEASKANVPPSVLANWKAFLAQWHDYFEANKAAWSAGHVHQAEQYRNQLRDWRNRLGKAAGFTLTSSKLPPRSSEPGWNWKSAAGGAAIVMGLLLMWALGRGRRF